MGSSASVLYIYLPRLPDLLTCLPSSHLSTANMGYVIGNIYFITAIAVIGGALFGFDIASMSAM